MECSPRYQVPRRHAPSGGVAVGAILALLLGAVAVLGAQRTDPPVVGAGQGDFAGLVDIGGGQRW